MASRLLALVLSMGFLGCAAAESGDGDDPAGTSEDHLEILNASKWFRWLANTHPDWAVRSDRDDADPSPWPGGFSPATARIFAHNEIVIEGVTPLEVYDLMTRPNEYRSFYPNAGEASTDRLRTVGQRYDWSTFGVGQDNTVTELVRDEKEARISWLAKSPGTDALHRWIFRAENGATRVITEECQAGWAPALPSFISTMATALPAAHELWLQGLRCRLVESAADDAMCAQTIRKDLASAPAP